jgi:hypothetical protein
MSLTCGSPSNVVMNTHDLMYYISSFCDYEELGALQCVSIKWYRVAGGDQLWQKLFARHFSKEKLPTIQCKEAFKNRLTPICPETLPEVKKIIITFMCQLKWNTKRELICTFSCSSCKDFCNHNNYHFTIQQGFGPKRGTEEGFKGAPEEVKYLQYNGNIIRTTPGGFFSYQQSGQCLKEEAPLFVSSDGLAPGGYYSCSSDDASFTIQQYCGGIVQIDHFDTPLEDCVHEYVEIDVGWGNTLGYCSEMNDWKSPFRLHCVKGEAGQSVWTGLFPKEYRFKFVLIDAKGGITWEQDNRFLGDNFSLKAECNRAPIKF